MANLAEISPHELARGLENGTRIQVLDIRAPERVAAGAIAVPSPSRFHNMPGSQLVRAGGGEAIGLDPAVPVAVVCGHGNSSKQIAAWLGAQGFDARSLRGGMARWMATVLPRPLAAPAGFDVLTQFDRLGKGALGYLLGQGGEAVVIDPPRATDPILAAAETSGLRITAVLDTHLHADYVSGGPSLAVRLGVAYHLHPADAVYPYDGTPGRLGFTPLADGQRIPVGAAALTVVHTPGHTEGSVTFLGDDAVAFTGDFVFVRSVGRPDLAGRADAWTDALWLSVERARREWPADLVVRPAHYVSDAERMADRGVGGRFGDLLKTNEPLALRTRDAFRAWVLTRTREAPEAYRAIKALNLALRVAGEAEIEDLEGGKNECAV